MKLIYLSIILFFGCSILCMEDTRGTTEENNLNYNPESLYNITINFVIKKLIAGSQNKQSFEDIFPNIDRLTEEIGEDLLARLLSKHSSTYLKILPYDEYAFNFDDEDYDDLKLLNTDIFLTINNHVKNNNSSPNSIIKIWSLTSASEPIAELNFTNAKVRQVEFSTKRNELLILCSNNKIRVYNLENRSSAKEIDLAGNTSMISLAFDDTFVCCLINNNSICFLNLDNEETRLNYFFQISLESIKILNDLLLIRNRNIFEIHKISFKENGESGLKMQVQPIYCRHLLDENFFDYSLLSGGNIGIMLGHQFNLYKEIINPNDLEPNDYCKRISQETIWDPAINKYLLPISQFLLLLDMFLIDSYSWMIRHPNLIIKYLYRINKYIYEGNKYLQERIRYLYRVNRLYLNDLDGKFYSNGDIFTLRRRIHEKQNEITLLHFGLEENDYDIPNTIISLNLNNNFSLVLSNDNKYIFIYNLYGLVKTVRFRVDFKTLVEISKKIDLANRCTRKLKISEPQQSLLSEKLNFLNEFEKRNIIGPVLMFTILFMMAILNEFFFVTTNKY